MEMGMQPKHHPLFPAGPMTKTSHITSKRGRDGKAHAAAYRKVPDEGIEPATPVRLGRLGERYELLGHRTALLLDL